MSPSKQKIDYNTLWAVRSAWFSYGLRRKNKRFRAFCKAGKGQPSLRKGHPCLTLTHFKERTFRGPVRVSRMSSYGSLTVPKTKDAKQGREVWALCKRQSPPPASVTDLRPRPQVATTQVSSNASQGTRRDRQAQRALAAPFET